MVVKSEKIIHSNDHVYGYYLLNKRTPNREPFTNDIYSLDSNGSSYSVDKYPSSARNKPSHIFILYKDNLFCQGLTDIKISS